MKVRRLPGAAMALVMAAGAVITADVAHAAPAAAGHTSGSVTIIGAVAITEVTPVGLKVTGLAVEYDGHVDLGKAAIDPAAFEVDVTLTRPGAEPRMGTRTVTSAQTSQIPQSRDTSRPGRYIVLTLDEADPLAGASYSDGYTRYYDLEGAYMVTQVKDIVGKRQVVEAAPDTPMTNASVRNLVVDDYDAGEFTSASGRTIPYRIYSPVVRRGHKYPLVVTLHGHGESGDDNFSQIAGNQISVAFADPARQARHPAFVLSPQAAQVPSPEDGGWWHPDVQAAVIELVETTIAQNPAIDTSRVYLTGLSMGSYGSWSMLPQHHDLFAAAILVCGAGEESAASTLGDFPVWAVHSADDSVVPYDAPGSDYRIFQALEEAGHPVTWTEWAGTAPDREQEALAAAARRAARSSGSRHIFTTFPAGTTPLFSHGSWIPTYTNDVIVDWLFSHNTRRYQ